MQCFRCGACCKSLELWVTGQELSKMQVHKPVTPIHKTAGKNRYKISYPVCPLYDGFGCIMYENRPTFCRMYHCGRRQEADERLSNAEVMRLAIADPAYKQFKDRLETDAVEWGNRYGWKFRRSNFLTLFYSSE